MPDVIHVTHMVTKYDLKNNSSSPIYKYTHIHNYMITYLHALACFHQIFQQDSETAILANSSTTAVRTLRRKIPLGSDSMFGRYYHHPPLKGLWVEILLYFGDCVSKKFTTHVIIAGC